MIHAAETPEDIAEVVRLCWAYRDFLLAYSDVDRRITETFYPVPKYRALMDTLAQEHARPDGILLLAKNAEGTAVGCGMSHALDPTTAEIKRVFVTDAARGTGVASRLCEAIVTQARKDGFERIVLDTSKSLLAAQQLYQKQANSRCPPYQQDPEAMQQD